MQPERLYGAILQPGIAGRVFSEAADVDLGQVHRRFAACDPVCEQHSRAARVGDAGGIEAGADEVVVQLRRLAQDEVAIGREALRAVDQLTNSGIGQRRYAADSEVHRWREVIEVRIEKLKLKWLRDTAYGPRNWIRFVAAHH